MSNAAQILGQLAQQAAQKATQAIGQLPKAFSDYAKSGAMDKDLRDFGKMTGEKIYEGLNEFFGKQEAGLGRDIIVSNLNVGATISAMEYATEGIARGFELATGAQRDFAESSRATFSTVTATLGAEMGKIATGSTQQVNETVNLTLNRVEEANKRAATKTVDTLGGVSRTFFQIIPNFAAALEQGNAAVLLNSQTYYRAARDMTGDTLANNAAIQKGFAITAAETTAFTLRDIERTGKATGDTLQQVVASSLAASDSLGVSSRVTRDQVTSMLNNVERYGASTETQLAAVSAQMQQLSLDVGTLDKLVGSFSNLDTAISKSNDLAALFGVQLDAVESMYLAAEDPTRLFEEIRNQLLEQGVDVENMSQSQLRALSRTLGTSVEETKRYLTGTVDSYDEAFTKIDDASKKMGAEEVAARAARMADDGSKRTAEAIKQAQADQLSALTISRTTAETVAQSNALIVSSIAKANEAQQTLYSETLEGTTKSLKQFNERMPELIREYVVPYFKQSLEAVGAFVKGSSSTITGTATAPAAPAAAPAPVQPALPAAPVPAAPGAAGAVSPPPAVPAPPVAPPAAPAAAPVVPLPPGTTAAASPLPQPIDFSGTINLKVTVDGSGVAVAEATATGLPDGVTVITENSGLGSALT